MKTPPQPSGDSPRSALDWPGEAGLGREMAREIRAKVARRRRRKLGVAGIACALLLGAFGWQHVGPQLPASATTLALGKVSAPERRVLPDGSLVELKPGAVIVVEYSADLRRVVLTSGEAHFEVAKNPARPFVVAADGVAVRAVGTAFAVGRGTGTVDVIVTEGRVTVAREAAVSTAEPAPLGAGDRALVAVGADAPLAPQVQALSAAELQRRLEWRVPRLEFSGTPLTEVVRMFAEHGPVHFTLSDPSLGRVKVSGLLRADNADALLQLLASDHAIEASAGPTGEIVLRRRN